MKKLLPILLALIGLRGAGLEVNLLEVDLAVRPGTVHTFSFVVRNETEVPETFTVYVGDWDRDELGGNRFYPPGTLPHSLSPWLRVTPSSFTLAPGAAREVQGTLTVLSTVAAGAYWGIVFVQGEPRPVQQGGTTVMVARRIGIKVYATVGSPRPQGEIRRVEFRGLNPLWLVVEFANSGRANLREVRVEVQVYDAQGKLLGEVKPDPVPCLPGGVRWVVAESELRPGPGTYLAVVRVDFGGPEVLAAQATLRVRPLALVPLRGGGLPQDLDGDGLYEDINGDGVFDEDDVALFRELWRGAAVQGNARAFDFDNSGRVDEGDVKALEALLAARSR